MKIPEWIRESNLIEDVNSSLEDRRSYMAWLWFKDQPLTLENILKIHKMIMRVNLRHRKDQLGVWRTVNVRVGYRMCPHWEQVPKLLDKWISLHGTANTDKTICSAHVQFEKSHPFIDGNGRTGRMIMNWQRVKAGLKPLCIKANERSDYYAWFEEYTHVQ